MNIEEVWSEYQSSLKAFLYKNISNPDDVEDLLQDILIKTYNNLTTLQDRKKIKSWLFQVANNTIIDFYRKRSKGNDISQEELWYTDSDNEIYQQLSMCVVPFINGLPKEEAALLTAIEIDGVSQKEHAEKLGMKYSTLKSRVQKKPQDAQQLI